MAGDALGIINTAILASFFTISMVNNNMKFDDVVSSLLTEQIDVRVIQDLESSNRASAVSQAGAKGIMQILPKAWADATLALGQDWPYHPDVFNKQKNIVVGSHYINNIIPDYLRAHRIPDTVELRLAAYNWGIGNLANAYARYGKAWQRAAPDETKDYINRYKAKVGQTVSASSQPDVIVRKPALVSAPKEYVVRPRDTLYNISQRLGVKPEYLQQKNPAIKDPNLLQPGQRLNY